MSNRLVAETSPTPPCVNLKLLLVRVRACGSITLPIETECTEAAYTNITDETFHSHLFKILNHSKQ